MELGAISTISPFHLILGGILAWEWSGVGMGLLGCSCIQASISNGPSLSPHLLNSRHRSKESIREAEPPLGQGNENALVPGRLLNAPKLHQIQHRPTGLLFQHSLGLHPKHLRCLAHCYAFTDIDQILYFVVLAAIVYHNVAAAAAFMSHGQHPYGLSLGMALSR